MTFKAQSDSFRGLRDQIRFYFLSFLSNEQRPFGDELHIIQILLKTLEVFFQLVRYADLAMDAIQAISC